MTITTSTSDEENSQKDSPQTDIEEGQESSVGQESSIADEEAQSDARENQSCYCPISKQVMREPVVIPTGESFDKTSILERGDVPPEKLYPNRALHEVILANNLLPDPVKADPTSSLQAGLEWVEKSFQSLSEVLDGNDKTPMHDAFYCPISMDLMHIPVIDPEGNTFEKVAVENWIRIHHNSPLTRNELELEDLYPNAALQDQLTEELSRLDESEHAWIEKWRNAEPIPIMEAPTTQTPTSARLRRLEQRRRDARQRQQTAVKAALFFTMLACGQMVNLIRRPPVQYFLLGVVIVCAFSLIRIRAVESNRTRQGL